MPWVNIEVNDAVHAQYLAVKAAIKEDGRTVRGWFAHQVEREHRRQARARQKACSGWHDQRTREGGG